MSLTGKKIKAAYKDFVHSDNSNNGIGLAVTRLKTGKGDSLPISVSTKTCSITPVTNTTDTFNVKNYSGTHLIKCNTTDMNVQAGQNNYYVNSSCKEFSLFDFTPAAGYHTPMITNPGLVATSGDTYVNNTGFGANGADPAATLDFSSNPTAMSKVLFPTMWHVPYECKLDAGKYFIFCEANNNIEIHAMKYQISSSGGTLGDLSGGTVLGTASLTANNTGIVSGTLSFSTTDIEADRVVLVFIENTTATSQMSANVQLQYHLN